MSENNLTHFDAAGNAVMVDVSEKPVTAREATAHGIITMNADAFAAVQSGTVKKGDVLGVELGEIHLVEKTGGKSGHYIRAEGGYV